MEKQREDKQAPKLISDRVPVWDMEITEEIETPTRSIRNISSTERGEVYHERIEIVKDTV
jgi:hypothetical protein